MDSKSVSNYSDLSDTIIPSIADSVNPDAANDDIFADDRINAIFSQGIIVKESRVTNKVEELAPKPFVESLVSKHSETINSFSSASTQRDFLESAAKSRASITSYTQQFDANRSVSIVDQINQSMIKGNKHVTFGNKQFRLPSIRASHINSVSQAIDIYIDELLITLSATYSLQGYQVNGEATKTNLLSTTNPCTRYLSTVRSRQQIYNLILAALVAEDLVTDQQSQFLHHIKYNTIVNDDATGGAFVRLTDYFETPSTRFESMVSQASIASAVSITYNLKLNQIRYLLSYLFDRDSTVRVESKINLLSSVNLDVRNDLVLSPGKVLLRSLAEHYLTRTEVLALVFGTSSSNRTDAAKRCPHCMTVCTMNYDSLNHGPCPVTDWLVKHCQFEYQGSALVAPAYAYLASGVAQYARALINLDAQRKLTPYVSRTEQEFRVVALDAQGATKVIAQHGSKSVRVTNDYGPSTSTSTPYTRSKR